MSSQQAAGGGTGGREVATAAVAHLGVAVAEARSASDGMISAQQPVPSTAAIAAEAAGSLPAATSAAEAPPAGQIGQEVTSAQAAPSADDADVNGEHSSDQVTTEVDWCPQFCIAVV